MRNIESIKEIAASLDDFDVQVLRACAGMKTTLVGWGAAVGERAGWLKRRGLLAGFYTITEKGRAVIAAREQADG